MKITTKLISQVREEAIAIYNAEACPVSLASADFDWYCRIQAVLNVVAVEQRRLQAEIETLKEKIIEQQLKTSEPFLFANSESAFKATAVNIVIEHKDLLSKLGDK